ncbi:uncharacterized protein LOC144582409 [Callithrix jacchus]
MAFRVQSLPTNSCILSPRMQLSGSSLRRCGGNESSPMRSPAGLSAPQPSITICQLCHIPPRVLQPGGPLMARAVEAHSCTQLMRSQDNRSRGSQPQKKAGFLIKAEDTETPPALRSLLPGGLLAWKAPGVASAGSGVPRPLHVRSKKLHFSSAFKGPQRQWAEDHTEDPSESTKHLCQLQMAAVASDTDSVACPSALWATRFPDPRGFSGSAQAGGLLSAHVYFCKAAPRSLSPRLGAPQLRRALVGFGRRLPMRFARVLPEEALPLTRLFCPHGRSGRPQPPAPSTGSRGGRRGLLVLSALWAAAGAAAISATVLTAAAAASRGHRQGRGAERSPGSCRNKSVTLGGSRGESEVEGPYRPGGGGQPRPRRREERREDTDFPIFTPAGGTPARGGGPAAAGVSEGDCRWGVGATVNVTTGQPCSSGAARGAERGGGTEEAAGGSGGPSSSRGWAGPHCGGDRSGLGNFRADSVSGHILGKRGTHAVLTPPGFLRGNPTHRATVLGADQVPRAASCWDQCPYKTGPGELSCSFHPVGAQTEGTIWEPGSPPETPRLCNSEVEKARHSQQREGFWPRD